MHSRDPGLAATPSDSPITPKPSCGSTFHKAASPCSACVPRCPAPREGLWQPGREGRRSSGTHPGYQEVADSRSPGGHSAGLGGPGTPIRSCLLPCYLRLGHRSSCWVGEAPENGCPSLSPVQLWCITLRGVLLPLGLKD